MREVQCIKKFMGVFVRSIKDILHHKVSSVLCIKLLFKELHGADTVWTIKGLISAAHKAAVISRVA